MNKEIYLNLIEVSEKERDVENIIEGEETQKSGNNGEPID